MTDRHRICGDPTPHDPHPPCPGMPDIGVTAAPAGTMDGMAAYHYEMWTAYCRAGFPPPYALQIVQTWIQIGAQLNGGNPADDT